VQYSAWIFRETNSASSRYAVISQRDMENFQRAVSQYTDDIAITIVDNQDIKVGKKVRLTKGEFAGCEGVIECEDVDNDSQLRNFYIRFTTNNSFKFQIKVSPDGVTLLD
jgi:transcription antitermination factor NusG